MKLKTRKKFGQIIVLSAPLCWTFIFLFVPYIILFTYSFYLKKFPTFTPAFQFGNYFQIFSDPQYFQVIFRSGWIAGAVALLALLLAYPFAYFLVFKIRSSTIRVFLYMAVIVPLWVSYLLRAYTWKTILGTEGILNSFLIWIGILSEPSDLFLYNKFSMILTLTYLFIPFTMMPIYSALEKIPRSLTEASKDLGVGPFRTFWNITLPLSMPGVLAGMTFTFCLTSGDFIAPMLVGGPDGFMIANVMTSQFGAALNWPLGSALSMIMLVVVLGVISLSDKFQRVGRVELG